MIYKYAIVSLLLINNNYAQCEPGWFKKPPYKYYSDSGSGATEEEALNDARANVIKQILYLGQIEVNPVSGEITNGNQRVGNIRIQEKSSCHVDNLWKAYVLISIDIGQNTTSPALAGLFSIVPGGGQLYKLDYGKSILFFFGTTGLLAGAYYSDKKMNDAYWASSNSKTIENKQTNESIGDNYKLLRNILLGSASILYLYNFYDAIFSEHYPRYDLALYYQGGHAGIVLKYNF